MNDSPHYRNIFCSKKMCDRLKLYNKLLQVRKWDEYASNVERAQEAYV